MDLNDPDTLGGWGPPWLELVDERRAHHDAASAILGSAVSRRGARQELAAFLAANPVSVTRLLRLFSSSTSFEERRDPDDAWHYSHTRTKEIAEHLGLPVSQRERLLYHAEMAKKRALAVRQTLGDHVASGLAPAVVDTVHQLYGEAEHTLRGGYERTSDAVTAVLASSAPADDPLTFVLLLLILHQCLCVLDKGHQAYYVARLATEICDRGLAYRRDIAFERYAVQARCAQGVALHNVHLDRDALGAFSEAAGMAGKLGVAPGFWTPMVARGKLLAASARSSRLYDVATLEAFRNELVLDGHTADPDRVEVLHEEAFARALANTGGRRAVKRAESIMSDLLGRLPGSALHAVQVLKTASRVAAAAGDGAGSAEHRARAESLARAARLTRDLATLQAAPPARATM